MAKPAVAWNKNYIAYTVDFSASPVIWASTKGSATGTILEFLRVGTTAAGWMLTDTNLYYAPDAFSNSPTWAIKMTLAAFRAGGGRSDAEFRGLAIHPTDPLFVGVIGIGSAGGGDTSIAAHTHNGGTSWTYVTIPWAPGNYWAENKDLAIDASYNFYTILGHLSGPKSYMNTSTDGGHSFGAISADLGPQDGGAPNVRFTKIFGSTFYVSHGALTNTFTSKTTDGGATLSSAVPAGYVVSASVHGLNAWDVSTLYAVFTKSADGSTWLAKSTNGGSTWTFIKDAAAVFVLSNPFLNSAPSFGSNINELAWVTDATTAVGVALAYSSDGGATFQDATGNWYALFTTWDGGTGSGGGMMNCGVAFKGESAHVYFSAVRFADA